VLVRGLFTISFTVSWWVQGSAGLCTQAVPSKAVADCSPCRLTSFVPRLAALVLLVPAAAAKAQATLLTGSERGYARRPWSVPDANRGEDTIVDESAIAKR
jgi:hypothetical protein